MQTKTLAAITPEQKDRELEKLTSGKVLAVPTAPQLNADAIAQQWLRTMYRRWPHNRRVALLGTGGLSHWVGPPETGKINEEFDRWFLDRLIGAGVPEIISRYARYEDLEAVAGNGGHEIRDWLAVAGAMPAGMRACLLAYEPLKAWSTGTGIVAWSLN